MATFKFILFWVLAIAAWYLLISFFNWNMNMGEWGGGSRFLFVLLSLLSAVGAAKMSDL